LQTADNLERATGRTSVAALNEASGIELPNNSINGTPVEQRAKAISKGPCGCSLLGVFFLDSCDCLYDVGADVINHRMRIKEEILVFTKTLQMWKCILGCGTDCSERVGSACANTGMFVLQRTDQFSQNRFD